MNVGVEREKQVLMLWQVTEEIGELLSVQIMHSSPLSQNTQYAGDIFK